MAISEFDKDLEQTANKQQNPKEQPYLKKDRESIY